jgi:probable selenium-dependent hydroxylase accessory protein YqeC
MKGVGRPLTEKWVFRCNRFAGLTGLKCGQTVSPAAVARALTAGNGLFKGSPAGAQRIALLNMADRRHRLTMARRIAWLLRNAPRAERPQRVVVGRILHPEPVIETYDV